MTEKTERIAQKIEAVPGGPAQETEEVLKFSPEEKAEQLWACWNEYRKGKYEALTGERKKPVAERKKLGEVEESPEFLQLKNKIAELWQDKAVQTLFKRNLEANLREKEKISPDLKDYRKKEEELKKIREEQEGILRDLFVHRGKEPGELTRIRYAEISTKIGVLESALERVFQENPELASFIQYERIREYARQYSVDRFMGVPSRRQYLEEIYLRLVNSEIFPLFLSGETGSGKTALVDAISRILTGDREALKPQETSGKDIRDIIARISLRQGEPYSVYKVVSEALSGKQNSLQKEPSHEGKIAFIDEANSVEYPDPALRAIIKNIRGKRPGDLFRFDAWVGGNYEKIMPKAALVLAGILPTKSTAEVYTIRHPARKDLSSDLRRELAGNIIQINYLEQTPQNPEIYEMLLAGLMDRNGRIRLQEGEIEPAWTEKVDPGTKEKTKVLDVNLKSGGTLWRFANLVAEIQRSYMGENNVLTPAKSENSFLTQDVLVAGDALKWLIDYKNKEYYKMPLKQYIQRRLKEWIEIGVSLSEDSSLLRELCATLDLPIEGPDMEKKDAQGPKIWSEKEIGFLSPRVPRPKEKIEAPRPISKIAFLEDGTEVEYQPLEELEEIDEVIVRGRTPDGLIVLEDKNTKVVAVVTPESLDEIRKGSCLNGIKVGLETTLRERGSRALNEAILQLIDIMAEQITDAEQITKLKEKVIKDTRRMSDREKIDYFLIQF